MTLYEVRDERGAVRARNLTKAEADKAVKHSGPRYKSTQRRFVAYAQKGSRA